MKPILQLKNINKSFLQGKQTIQVLKDANLEIMSSEIVALIGDSGSGKTTILQIAGLLDNPDSGSVVINYLDLSGLSDKERTDIRRDNIGFVYQFHHLLPEFSALENVAMPLLIRGINNLEAQTKAKKLLEEVNLGDRLKHRPSELSGGEQQRVAIARAIVGGPNIILADEPTGNLDPYNAENISNLLINFSKNYGISCLMVTHNHNLAKKMDRIVTIKEGKLMPFN